MQPRRADFESLVRRVRVLERGADRPDRLPLATGWPGVDRLLGGGGDPAAPGGLARGAVHEFLGLEGPRLPDGGGAPAQRTRGGAAGWTPPLFLLAHLARRALVQDLQHAGAGAERWILWIGRRVWPYPRTLTRVGGLSQRAADVPDGVASAEGARFELELADAFAAAGPPIAELDRSSAGAAQCSGSGSSSGSAGERSLLDHSLFIDPPDRKGLLWAVDAGLRCPSVAAVVADGSGLTMPASRRLQLAAEAGSGLCLLTKPPDEVRALSAAATRWRVRRGGLPGAADVDAGESFTEPSTADGSFERDEPFEPGDRPRWDLELLRSKPGFARVEVRRAARSV